MNDMANTVLERGTSFEARQNGERDVVWREIADTHQVRCEPAGTIRLDPMLAKNQHYVSCLTNVIYQKLTETPRLRSGRVKPSRKSERVFSWHISEVKGVDKIVLSLKFRVESKPGLWNRIRWIWLSTDT